MKNWKTMIKESVVTPQHLAALIDVDLSEITTVHNEFPLRASSYYLGLIKERNDPIWRQVIPDVRELDNESLTDDPLGEEYDSPAPQITHRYPDRVLFYVSATCSVYCRFCTRKRKVGKPQSVCDPDIEQGLAYIREHDEIRDVVISGGDPLMLSDEKIEYIVSSLRKNRHIKIIRIGSRVPVTLPYRITDELCEMLRKYHPLYLNTHFNHPDEITEISRAACNKLASAGIVLGNQTVLLKGVNDNPAVMRDLFQKLLSMRVRPYYLYQMDLVNGTNHFRTSVACGLDIIRSLRGHTSGLAVPHYVIDAPAGGGKIALIPDPVVEYSENNIVLMNYEGNTYRYPVSVIRKTEALV